MNLVVPATCGNIANGAEELKYEQVGRDIVAMFRVCDKSPYFDGLGMIVFCDNIIAGCYMAVMSDIPSTTNRRFYAGTVLWKKQWWKCSES